MICHHFLLRRAALRSLADLYVFPCDEAELVFASFGAFGDVFNDDNKLVSF
jgi:hypothetical protein